MKNITFILICTCICSVAYSQLDSGLYYIDNYQFPKAITFYEKKLKTFKYTNKTEKVVDVYNSACAHALNNNSSKCFEKLNYLFSIDSSTRKTFFFEPDFYNIVNTKEWKTFVLKNRPTNLQKMNKELFFKLSKLAIQDQAFYKELNCKEVEFGVTSIEVKKIWKIKDSLNKENLEIVKAFVNDSINVLSSKVVGDRFASKCFLVIQHSDSATMTNYLPIIEDLYKKGETKGENYALLYDRVSLLKPNGTQYYGTQVNEILKKPFPIRDEKNVNKRRGELGMIPLESYLSQFGINYRYKP